MKILCLRLSLFFNILIMIKDKYRLHSGMTQFQLVPMINYLHILERGAALS